MEAHAHTDAEWSEVTADTGRLFGPILVGIPFAIVYTVICWASVALVGWLSRSLLGRSDGDKTE